MKSVLLFTVGVVSLASANLARTSLIQQGRIVGGIEASIEDFPYFLQFEYGGYIRCSASIYNAYTAITTATCVDGIALKNAKLREGSDQRGSGGTLHQANKFIPHPIYKPSSFDYDIALVIVDEPFNTTNAIPLVSSVPPTNSTVTVTGMGVTDQIGNVPIVLHTVDLEMVDHDACDYAFFIFGGVTDRMICAAAPNKDACEGDNGSPLEYNGELAGIVSWGVGCAQVRYPGVYSNIALFKSWIENNAA